ncbi:MAG: AI-2E family transporter [Gemmatimonadota bacterium]|nr:MAG: AI-2E family transporter [Gemmatimonadota bacterium]
MPRSAAQDRFSKGFLLLLTIAVSILFYLMIRPFFMAVLLAGIFSGMAYPLYRRLVRWFKGHKAPASIATILIVLLLIVGPLSGFLGIVATQAINVSQSVTPWVEQQVSQTDRLDELLSKLPFYERWEPYQHQIAAKIGEFAGNVGSFLVNSVASATRGTASFMLSLFIMLYAMFFFLMGGREILDKILYYMPLGPKDENRMVEKFVSVTRATIKGTLVIGLIQGTLAGLGFFVAGIGGAAFWGTVMAVLSIIPGVGTALVWIPAVIYLIAVGKIWAGVLLGLWCIAIVGTVDNVLRPYLVGRDTKMSDLMILLGTLGGILIFGAVGFIVGPIIAALFVTIWEMYGEAFKEYLPEVTPLTGEWRTQK